MITMSHKEMCIEWVEDRTVEGDGGLWYAQHWTDNHPFGGPFDTEDELSEFLWDQVMKCDWADFGLTGCG